MVRKQDPGSDDFGGFRPPRADTRPQDGHCRRIVLVDCDSFFVQVARLEDPEGAGRQPLLIVGGSPESRGVVASASYAARAYGVRSAMPTAHALRLCPAAVVAPVARQACIRRSREVRHTLEKLAPVVRAASIDEFYLDLSGTERMLAGETLEDTARRIRLHVLERTGISVSAGGGTTRIIAKLATKPAKPGGVHVVAPGDETEFMRRFELGDIPGVGPAFLARLERHGLRSVRDVLSVQPAWLERWLGTGRAHWLLNRARGRDGDDKYRRPRRKSVSTEQTFAEDISADEELEDILFRQAASVARRIRKLGLGARTITVKIRDRDFSTRRRSLTLARPVESDGTVFEIARTLLLELRTRRRTPARLLGLAVGGFTDADGEEAAQLALFPEFEDPEPGRARRISRIMDLAKD